MASNAALKGACPGTRRSLRLAVNQFSIDRELYAYLTDGKSIIRRWSDQASLLLERGSGQPFEPFIYAYIALNGWAACCSGTDTDRFQVETMAADPVLETEFQALCQADLSYLRSAETFRDLWPIFKAAELRRRQGELRPNQRPFPRTRRDLVDYYLAQDPPIERSPSCYPKHVTEGYPLDWAHTVDALYRVRCNLFHGEKGLHNENDKAIVTAAADVLVPFLKRLLDATWPNR